MRLTTFTAIAMMIPFCVAAEAQPVRQRLDTGWTFRQGRLNNWYPAVVPGTVHTDLMRNKKIDDPYFRLNERGAQWIDKEDWIYRTSFTLPADMKDKERIDLVFEGLDTYADVSLNGHKILSADNMFRGWRESVKPYLKDGANSLEVYFHSPIKRDIPKWDSIPFHYEAGNDQSENGGVFDKKVSVFARKAGYHYGWDWGPRLVTSGIWRPVFVEAWSEARLSDVFMRQLSVSSRLAKLAGEVEVTVDKAMAGAEIVIADKVSGKKYAVRKVDLRKGVNKFSLPFSIKNPKLWWCNGLGEPHLYQFVTTVRHGQKTIDRKEETTGIRSIRVVRKPDQYGKTFYFELNGVPVFMKGANYIPQDVFLPRVTQADYEKTIKDAVDVHMNMLRVWGGGIYENDLFYDLCDRNGLLVWQDFMFACSLYPAEGEWLENVRQEAIDNVRRLRNHPCIALWCGNNECQDAWFNWGYRKNYTKQNPEWAAKIWKQYNDQYFDVLPKVVKEYAPETFYTSSSPFGLPNQGSDDHNGDYHYWEVWQGFKPVSAFNTQKSRFFSEYGFQSFPDIESVKRYAPEAEDWSITSDVMMSHQRGGALANSRMEKIMNEEYRKPKDFPSFLYMSQVLQADAIKVAMEAHRRQKPYNMGSLVWQHNDCWPVASWSSRDYYGRWKAQHYFTRKSFADILVSPVWDGQNKTVEIYLVSDRMKSCKGVLSWEVRKFDGTLIGQSKKEVSIEANGGKCVAQVDVRSLPGWNPKETYLRAVYTAGKHTYDNNFFFLRQKEVDFPKPSVSTSLRKVEDGYELSLKSKQFARAAWISTGDGDASFSDNYMDLLPGKEVKVKIHTKLPMETLKKQLKVTTVADTY